MTSMPSMAAESSAATMLPPARRRLGPLWYAAAVLLAAAAAAAGVWVGRARAASYRSEGLVRIAHAMPEVMRDDMRIRPMIDSYMAVQKLLITSRRVVDMAAQDPVWRELGQRVPEPSDRYFAEHLRVEVEPQSELIRIAVVDDSPSRAAAAVTSTINAYQAIYNQQEEMRVRQRIGILQDEKLMLESQVKQLEIELASTAKDHGTTDLERVYQLAADRVAQVEAALMDLRLAQAGKPATRTDAEGGRESAGREAALQEIADAAREELRRIGHRGDATRRLEQSLTATRAEHAAVAQRLRVLQAEHKLGGDLTVIASGNIPLSPTHPEAKRAAAGAAIGGGVAVAVLFVLRLRAAHRRRGRTQTMP